MKFPSFNLKWFKNAFSKHQTPQDAAWDAEIDEIFSKGTISTEDATNIWNGGNFTIGEEEHNVWIQDLPKLDIGNGITDEFKEANKHNIEIANQIIDTINLRKKYLSEMLATNKNEPQHLYDCKAVYEKKWPVKISKKIEKEFTSFLEARVNKWNFLKSELSKSLHKVSELSVSAAKIDAFNKCFRGEISECIVNGVLDEEQIRKYNKGYFGVVYFAKELVSCPLRTIKEINGVQKELCKYLDKVKTKKHA